MSSTTLHPHPGLEMNYFPWIAGGAALGYAARHGRRSTDQPVHSEYGHARLTLLKDGVTVRPLNFSIALARFPRRKGTGTKLFAHVLGAARQHFPQAHTVRVYAATEDVASFWKKQGFHVVGPGGFDSILLERPLYAVASGRGRRTVAPYPVAQGEVSGLVVRSEIPNTESISATLYEWETLPNVREVPMGHFPGVDGRHYASWGNRRISALAEAIKESGEITPLIVVIDTEGPYILEGATRIEALYRLGVPTFPALVVENQAEGQRR